MSCNSFTIWASLCLICFYSSSIAQEYTNLNKKELRQLVLDRDSILLDVRGKNALTIGLVSIEKDTLEQVSLRTAALDKDVVSLKKSVHAALIELDELKKITTDLERQVERKKQDAAPYRSYIADFKKSAGVK